MHHDPSRHIRRWLPPSACTPWPLPAPESAPAQQAGGGRSAHDAALFGAGHAADTHEQHHNTPRAMASHCPPAQQSPPQRRRPASSEHTHAPAASGAPGSPAPTTPGTRHAAPAHLLLQVLPGSPAPTTPGTHPTPTHLLLQVLPDLPHSVQLGAVGVGDLPCDDLDAGHVGALVAAAGAAAVGRCCLPTWWWWCFYPMHPQSQVGPQRPSPLHPPSHGHYNGHAVALNQLLAELRRHVLRHVDAHLLHGINHLRGRAGGRAGACAGRGGGGGGLHTAKVTLGSAGSRRHEDAGGGRYAQRQGSLQQDLGPQPASGSMLTCLLPTRGGGMHAGVGACKLHAAAVHEQPLATPLGAHAWRACCLR